MTLEEIKPILIAKLKEHYTDSIIYPVYPQWKQGNIDQGRCGRTPQEKIDMDIFLNQKWTDQNLVEAEINLLSDTAIYDSFVNDTDANLILYVASYIPTLTTDEQKLAVAMAMKRTRPIESAEPITE